MNRFYIPKLFFLIAYLLVLNTSKAYVTQGNEDEKTPSRVDQLNNEAENLLFTQPDSAYTIAHLALQVAESLKYMAGEVKAHELLGTIFYHEGVYAEALKHFEFAERYFRANGNSSKVAENQSKKGLVYYSIKNGDQAMKEHWAALDIYEKLGDKKGLALAYGNIGRLFEKKQEYKEALQYQQKALGYYQELNDKKGVATIIENIGSIYEDKEEYSLALDHYSRSLNLSYETNDSLSLIVCLNNIGDIYRKTGRLEEALTYTTHALRLSSRLNEKYQESSAYKDLSKIYHLKGDFEKAYKNLELGRTLYEEMYESESTRQLGIMQTLFDSEKKNNEILLLENNEKLSNWIKAILCISLFLVLLIGVFIIKNQKHRIYLKNQLILQNNQVFEAQNLLMNKELENVQLREKQLLSEIETKGKSLTAHTLHIIGKNKILEEIRDNLSNLLKGEGQVQKRQLKSIVKIIDQNIVHDKDWKDFRMIFEQVHQDFFEELTAINPDLTPAELRLAALIRLNLPSRDIATTLGISQDSLRIARYRLRKKLGVEEGKSITNFILSK